MNHAIVLGAVPDSPGGIGVLMGYLSRTQSDRTKIRFVDSGEHRGPFQHDSGNLRKPCSRASARSQTTRCSTSIKPRRSVPGASWCWFTPYECVVGRTFSMFMADGLTLSLRV